MKNALAVFLFLALPFNVAAQLLIRPTEVSLAAPSSGISSPAVAEATLSISTAQPVPFTASVSYIGGQSGWLTITPQSGTAPTLLTITADADGLPDGNHLAQVNVQTATGGVATNVLFAVGVGATANRRVVADHSALTFVIPERASSSSQQTLQITAAAGAQGPVSFRTVATSAGGWLTAPPFTQTTPATVTVDATTIDVAHGTYSGTITLVPLNGGDPTVVPVVLAAQRNSGIEPVLLPGQHEIRFNHQLGAIAPAFQDVTLETGGVPRLYTATTSTPWLRLLTLFSPSPETEITDFAPGRFRVQADPTGLQEDVPYTGSITIASAGLPTQTIPVHLSIDNAPALNASPSSLNMRDTLSTVAFITITSTGSSSLPFTVSVPASASWLTVTPTTGSTASGFALLTVIANPAELTFGEHTTTITLATQNGIGIDIPVRLEVTTGSANTGTLSASPESLELRGIAGLPVAPGVIALTSSGNGLSHPFSASAESEGGWLVAEPFAGHAPASIRVSINPSARPAAGTHTGTVVITSLLNATETSIPVTLNLEAQGLSVDRASLSFAPAQSGVDPAPQTIRVVANTASTFSARSETPWIRVSPAQGETPATVTVWASVANLPPGTASGSVLIIGPNNQVSVPVQLEVPPLPTATATPASVDLTYTVGAPAPTATVSLGGTQGVLSFAATAATESGVNWLTVSPVSGRTPSSITLTVDPTSLVPGTHTGIVTVRTTDPNTVGVTIPVKVTVATGNISLQNVLHSASGAPTSVAPGLLVTLTGSGLGPLSGVIAQPTAAGAIPTIVAETEVLFDDVPAPILFVRHDQINAIVPYAVDGRLSTRVQVRRGTNYSLPVQLRVVETQPGLFATGAGGRGQAAALNSDFSVNSLANPAARGSVIAIYGTGEGQTDPLGQDGRIIASDLRRPRHPATATIGGVPAEVLYIGSASGMVSGAFQANLRIPQEVADGAVPVVLQVGGSTTQTGVTIGVR